MYTSTRIEKLPNGFYAEVGFENGVVKFEYKRVHEKGEALTGLLLINLEHFGDTYQLYSGNFNCTASRTRKDLANYLKNTVPKTVELNWTEIIEWFSQQVIERYYESSPVLKIEPLEKRRLEFTLYPIIPKRHPALIFAPGGSGKSFVAMYLSLYVQNGISFDGEHEVEKGNVLYLDWEVDYEEAARRYGMLTYSFPDFENLEFPFYKRCELTLKDEIDDILQSIAEHDIKLVIIDSAAPAVGGDINDAQKILTFFQKVRLITSVGASVLILTHVSKAQREAEDEKEKTPIGSVFFENLARVTWELKYLSNEEGIIDFALFPRKSNFGKLPPVGLRAVFKYDGVVFTEIDPVPLESGNATKTEIIKSLLIHPRTLKELSELTGFKKNYISRVLTDLKRRGMVENTEDGYWQLKKDS